MRTTMLVLVCLLCAAASAQEWIARYTAHSGRVEVPEAVAVNDSGEILVAGYARGLTLIKYSPAGETMWVRTRPRPDLAPDTNGVDVAVQSYGTVLVVAGVRRDSFNGFRLVNFTSNGTCQFDTVFWHSVSDYPPSGGKVHLTTTNNDVAYVLARTFQDSTNVDGSPDGVLCKFLADPRLRWTRYINHGYRYWDDVWGMSVDSRQGIHIVGETSNGVQRLAYATKYDSSGAKLWKTTLGNESLAAAGWAVSGTPSATYWAGVRRLSPTGPRMGFLGKLNTNGGSSWCVSDSAEFVDLVTDATGNLYVAANRVHGMYDSDLATLVYNPAGQLQWRKMWAFPESVGACPRKVLLSRVGDVVAAGDVNCRANHNFFGVRYTGTGTMVWNDTSPTLEPKDTHASDALLDRTDDLIVTGHIVTSGSSAEWVTMKFHPVGAVAEPGAEPVLVRPSIGILPAVASAACRISSPGWAGPLVVADRAGRVVRTLAPGSWDLRDGGGRRVADGVYFVLAPPQSGLSPARLVVTR